jgi:putative Holliday junction resolvase
MKPQGVFLAFDFGTKKIGCAVGQTITQTASPLASLRAQDGIPPWHLVQTLINHWEPKGLIVGLPLQPDGKHSQTSLAAQKFGRRLKERFGLPVYFIEERLTTVAARERLADVPYSQRNVDSMAAAIILESWFNSDGKEISSHE